MKKMISNKHYINYFDSHLCLYLRQDVLPKRNKIHHKRHLFSRQKDFATLKYCVLEKARNLRI